jgi:hypothetical protein
VRLAALAPALALAALALTGCETSAERSAKLEREVRAHLAAQPVQRGLQVTRQSTLVSVVRTQLVHGSEGSAAVVTLRNTSATALREVPIEITARDARGATVYTNTAPGLARSLTSVSALAPHGELTWVDDQIPAAGAPVSILARVGQAPAVSGAIPALAAGGTRLFEDPTNGVGAEGDVANRSNVTQRELVVYVTATRGGSIVAAGRAVLPIAPAGAPTRFQVFFIGNPQGGRLDAAAPPSTLR